MAQVLVTAVHQMPGGCLVRAHRDLRDRQQQDFHILETLNHS